MIHPKIFLHSHKIQFILFRPIPIIRFFIHSLRYHQVFGIKRKRENATDNDSDSLIKSCAATKTSHCQDGPPFHCGAL